jgi:anthranilate/para-aminobenzoate synthase component I
LAAKVQNRDVAASFRLGFAEPPEPAQEHLQRVSRALELIRQGDIYQVNLARRFRLRFEGHSVDLLERLGRLTGAPFSALLGLGEVEMVSSSPELFIEMRPDGGVVTSPIKGTRARGSDARKDGELAEELERDPKERAELVMVIDVERNDLGKVCRPGSVRLLHPPRVETFATLHHRLASIGGELRPEVTRGQLLAAMLPSGSVTGAPKIRAMEVIAELEAHRRGLYTGAFGAVAHDGGMRLAMAIRTLTLRGAEAHYFSGGGIVADSDPRREVLETEWKASHIRALLAAGG